MDLDYMNSAALIRPRSFSFHIEREMREEDMVLNAIFSFNANPSIGIRSLCRLWNLEETPMNIAHILRHRSGKTGVIAQSPLFLPPGNAQYRKTDEDNSA